MTDQSLQQKLQTAKSAVKVAIAESAEAERLTADLVETMKQLKIIRTGRLMIVTTVRNNGDTDGLIMSVAENSLILNKNSAKLPIKLIGACVPTSSGVLPFSGCLPDLPVVSVPKRGAVTITFLLDPAVLPDPPRVAITNLIKEYQYSDLRGKVILKDTRNRDVESKEFDFPAPPEEQ